MVYHIKEANILAEHGHTVYLVPEAHNKGIGMKEYDAIVDGRSMDFKTVIGSLNKVASNFSKGIEQAENVFLKTDNDYSYTEIYKAILGKLKTLQVTNTLEKKHINGHVYIYKTDKKILYKWNIKKMIEDLK